MNQYIQRYTFQQLPKILQILSNNGQDESRETNISKSIKFCQSEFFVFRKLYLSLLYKSSMIISIYAKYLCILDLIHVHKINDVFIAIIASEQKTMQTSQILPQFKDNFFINRFNLTHHSRNSFSSLPQSKITRSTWTRKVMKQKQNQQKLKKIIVFREQDWLHRSQPISKGRITKRNNGIATLEHSPTKNNNSQRSLLQGQTPDKEIKHFSVNRNVFSLQIHDQLSKSGILLEHLEGQNQLNPKEKQPSSRIFLKTLKIKANVNLYKGNFSKFTKKQIVRSIKTKRKNLNQTDLSPWSHENTARHML